MIWKSIVSPRAIARASARWFAKSGFARKTIKTVSDFARIVHNLVIDVRDSYRPELQYMRGLARNGAPRSALVQIAIDPCLANSVVATA